MKHTVFVCTSCGAKEGKRSLGRGTVIFQKLQLALADDADIDVKPVGCLSNCNRGGTVGLSAEGKFGWLFGEKSESDADISALAHSARAYARLHDGFLPKIDRTKPVVARIPPFSYEND